MTNKKGLYIIIVVLAVIIIGGGILLLGNNGTGKKTQEPATETPAAETSVIETPAAESENEMVDCGLAEDPMCFMTRMNECLPVTVQMTSSDGTTRIDMTIFGVEDENAISRER